MAFIGRTGRAGFFLNRQTMERAACINKRKRLERIHTNLRALTSGNSARNKRKNSGCRAAQRRCILGPIKYMKYAEYYG